MLGLSILFYLVYKITNCLLMVASFEITEGRNNRTFKNGQGQEVKDKVERRLKIGRLKEEQTMQIMIEVARDDRLEERVRK